MYNISNHSGSLDPVFYVVVWVNDWEWRLKNHYPHYPHEICLDNLWIESSGEDVHLGGNEWSISFEWLRMITYRLIYHASPKIRNLFRQLLDQVCAPTCHRDTAGGMNMYLEGDEWCVSWELLRMVTYGQFYCVCTEKSFQTIPGVCVPTCHKDTAGGMNVYLKGDEWCVDTLAVSILMEYNTNILQTAWDATEGASWRETLPINEEWWW